jgi:DNA mismatch repair ATPase MutS
MIENDYFQLPISFLHKKKEIDKHIITDLELVSVEKDNIRSLYEHVFNPTTFFGKRTIHLWSKYYTSDKNFILDSQKLYTCKADTCKADTCKADTCKADTCKADAEEKITNNYSNSDVPEVWNEIKSETGFIEKYQYVEWIKLEQLNNNSQFLQLLSIYNMTSPVLSLLLPVFFLILPFFILKMQGIPISTEKYFELLRIVFQKHHIGQLFALGTASLDKVVYIFVSFAFYILQIYSNVTSCIKFCKNMTKIHDQLFTIRDYLDQTLKDMKEFEDKCALLPTYQLFITDMKSNSVILKQMHEEFSQILPNKISINKFKQVGHVMKCFYQLYNKAEYHKAMQYAFGFTGYIENLAGIQDNIKNNNINPCKLHKKKTKFVEAYFPAIVNIDNTKDIVKNTYSLDKQILVTGPNAAGKTTMLKTTIFNIILSQQIGYGFYLKGQLAPYDFIHCYINIPDTSDRDSLFQAEARRCKIILDKIVNEGKKTRHFCVFDELYSGTNPYEAIGSAYSYLTYLNKYDNVSFLLTTHYIDLCKKLESVKKIQNYHMNIDFNKDFNKDLSKKQDFKYTYKMIKGISEIKGGVKVLNDLEYPEEIIRNTSNIIYDLKL